MSHVKPLTRGELAEYEVQFVQLEELMGFLPSSQLAMGRVPGLVPAFRALSNAVLRNDLIPGPLKMMIAMMTSAGAGCRYCQAHTGHNASRLGVSDEKIAAVWEFETSPLFDDAERAALQLAFNAGQVPNAVTAADFAKCREYFDDDQITAIVSVCAMFGYLNRWNDTMATTLEDVVANFGATVLSTAGWEPGKHGS